jgi:GTP-binding protein YchF
MKLGLFGLPQSGKSTIFSALTGARGDSDTKGAKKDNRIASVKVMDERIDFLSNMYTPKKTTYASVEYLLPSDVGGGSENMIWNQVRVCDALIHVVRNFPDFTGDDPSPENDYKQLEDEMILNDLMVVEKRIERIEADLKRGKKPDEDEHNLVLACKELLDKGEPLRSNPELASSPLLKGFTFLSAKPQLVIINNDDDNDSLPEWSSKDENIAIQAVRGRLEMEIAAMSEEDAEMFRSEYSIEESALDRIIKESYRIMNLMSFFTVGEDEVKAWTIKKDTIALEAAGEIHSDIQKGFIRAEVLAYDDLIKYGTFKDAKAAGRVRLEGKEYVVEDGDIINYRFNV